MVCVVDAISSCTTHLFSAVKYSWHLVWGMQATWESLLKLNLWLWAAIWILPSTFYAPSDITDIQTITIVNPKGWIWQAVDSVVKLSLYLLTLTGWPVNRQKKCIATCACMQAWKKQIKCYLIHELDCPLTDYMNDFQRNNRYHAIYMHG